MVANLYFSNLILLKFVRMQKGFGNESGSGINIDTNTNI